MFLAIALAVLVVGNLAQIRMMDPCHITPMANFNTAEFMGRWYEYARYPIVNVTGRCEQRELVENTDGTVTQHSQFYPLDGADSPIIISLTLVSDSPATFTTPKEDVRLKFNTTIIDTDYVSYSVEGHCELDESSVHTYNYNYWIYGRSIEPSQTASRIIDQVLRDQWIPLEYFEKMNQTNCLISNY